MGREEISVVVADDNGSMRSVLRTIIKSEGYTVVAEAADCVTTRAAAARFKPTVLTLDLTMPDGSSVDQIAEIRRVSPGTHILVVSASDDEATVRRCFDLGVVGYITKPFNAERILRLFDQLSSLATKKTPAAPATPVSKTGKRCILVDDNRSIRTLLKAVLAHLNIAVIGEAENGIEGLVAIERERPDFVFLDVDMPELDGLNTLVCLRAVHPSLPVVMVTSHADRETVSRSIDSGINAYLIKPFDADKLSKVLAKIGMR